MTHVILHVGDLHLHLDQVIPQRDHFILVLTNSVDVLPVAIQSFLMLV